MQSKISNKELAAIRVMRSFLMKEGRMPSVRELMKEMDYKSPRSASVIITDLMEKGVLRKKDDGSIQLVQYEIEADDVNSEQTVKIPVLGTITCGIPILAQENIEAELQVSTKLAKAPHKYFLLRARGDSMNERGINDGDLVLVRQQENAANGDLVVALIDDEATIKELRVNNDSAVLMPRSTNKLHMPIILARNFIVQGVVMAVIPGV